MNRQDAYDRARELLTENISEEQRARLFIDGHIEVKGGRTGATYRVTGSYVAVIAPYSVRNICAYPLGSVRDPRCQATGQAPLPDADSVLALALYIQHDELRFLKSAWRLT